MTSFFDFNSADGISGDGPTPPDWAQGPSLDRDDVRASLLSRLEGVLGYLYPQGFADKKGHKFYIGDINGLEGESLSVELTGEKAGLWHDFATGEGGDVFDLWKAARGCVSFREALQDAASYTGAVETTPRRTPKRKNPKGGEAWGMPTATYRYTDVIGKLLAEVERYDWEKDGEPQKTFRPWDVKQRAYRAPETRPLYNLPNISSAPEIIVCEGEKAADALIAQNIDATTAMGGSNAPIEKTDWGIVKGRLVVIWPDNDEAGKAYAERLKSHLEAEGAAGVSILTIPQDRPHKWDAADAEGEDLGALIRAMRPAKVEAASSFKLTPWSPVNFAAIPRVDFLYNRFYARGYTSVTAAPPKVGKSLLGLVEAVDMATGRGLLTGETQAPLRVYYYNAEDDLHTIYNRVAGILEHYGIDQSELVDRLYVQSGVADDGFYVISGAEGEINEQQFQAMEAEFSAHSIDVTIFDPLQDLSRSPETNEVMRILGARLRKMAQRCQLGIGLIHHTRKMQAGVKASIDDMRGGSALRGTARFNRLLVPMSEDEGAKAGVSDHRAFFQVGDIEGNLAPPSSDYARWYEKVSVWAPNGESVGVIASWDWPDAFDGINPAKAIAVREAITAEPERTRKDPQSIDWVGHLVGEVLGIDTDEKAGKDKVKSVIKAWLDTGVLANETRNDRQRRPRPHIVSGPNDPREVGA